MSFSIRIGLLATIFLLVIALLGAFIVYVSFIQNDFLIFLAGYIIIIVSIVSFFALGVVDVVVKKGKYFDMSKLIGNIAEAKTNIEKGSKGIIYAEGEEWTAIALEEIKKGDEVIIEKIEGGIVYVKKKK